MIKAACDPASFSRSGKKRARGWGLPVPGMTGPCNAITDVPGVAVGMTTLIKNEPAVVRTGVTAILPRAPGDLLNPVWAGCFSMNGNGEMTGTHWINEAGWFTGPVTVTNTLSLGMPITRRRVGWSGVSANGWKIAICGFCLSPPKPMTVG